MFRVAYGFKFASSIILFLLTTTVFLFADEPFNGIDAVPDLYSPGLAGQGGFSTSAGGAPASALNPAQAGDQKRIVFDAGYLAIPGFGDDKGYLQSIELGALFPTRYGVFGTSARYIGQIGSAGPAFEHFPVLNTFSGNIFAAKEIYPGMNIGAGFNYAFGEATTISGDLGFRYNTGKLGPFDNFTWAIVLRGLGKSYFPTWFSPIGGIAFDLIHVYGKDGKKDPFVMGVNADLGILSLFYPIDPYFGLFFKAGLNIKIAELIILSASWPGGSGFNSRELKEDSSSFQKLPSIGLSINFILPSGGERIAGGRLPSDGDLKIDAAYKPLYNDITAVGGGLSWYAGITDKKPPVITIDYPETTYFSPNHDGKADRLEFNVSIADDHYVAGWEMHITNEDGVVIRTIQNKEQRPESASFKDFWRRLTKVKKQIDVPPVFSWDGILDSGEMAKDGKYHFKITAVDDSGNTAESQTYDVILDNTPPVIRIAALTDAQKIFNPKGGGGEKNNVTFALEGSAEEKWESGIWDADDVKIRSFKPISGSPKSQVWDGRDDAGGFVPDGVYSFRISAVDRAQNSASAVMNNIILDAREAGVFITSSESRIAPKPQQVTGLVDFTIRLLLQDGIDNWKLELKDSDGIAQRTFSGGRTVPQIQSWNGLDDQGKIREGRFAPELTVSYTKGDVVTARATPVLVDVSGPALTFNSTPEYFSPDDDGADDELTITLSAQDASPIAGWSLEIRDPESGAAFYRVEGKSNPTPRLVWNGRSNIGTKNELVQSATDYPYTFKADDILGNASSIEGKIGIDVLVIRDGDKLRILIPSIVFRPNFADFNELPKETVDNNTRILRRIAQILNKFRDYKVLVEGHANPTTAPGPQRDKEEQELKQLSEARARKVVDELVRYNVARSRLSYVGVGGTRLIVPYNDLDNRWKNRRVEFILIK